MERTILLIDMDAYFASVEQVSNPSLRGKPIIVCGRGRTVVTTASYEARAFGVKTGMTVPEARALCPSVIPVHGTIDKYVDTSLKIHRILLRFSDQVEVFSIDECFVDITHRSDPRTVAAEIKKHIRDELSLSCSIGMGPNKLVAKLASKMQKPDGLVEIRCEDIPRVFSTLTVDDLRGVGVGKKLAAKLKETGIRTVPQLAAAPLDRLAARFGVLGHYLKNLSVGEDSSAVRKYDEHDAAKSFGHSHTLARDSRDLEVLKAHLLLLAEKASARMREAGCTGGTVSLTVRYADFSTFSRQHRGHGDLRTGYEVYRSAYALFEKLLPLRQSVRLLGVSISGIQKDDRQRFLFQDMERRVKLAEVVDEVNRKYGGAVLKPSSILIAERFGIERPCAVMGKYMFKKK